MYICSTELTGTGMYWSRVVFRSEMSPTAERVDCREWRPGSGRSLEEEGGAVPVDLPEAAQSD